MAEHERPEGPPKLTREQQGEWAGRLFQKLATTVANSREAGTSSEAAQKEVWRQMHEVANEATITKSGGEE